MSAATAWDIRDLLNDARRSLEEENSWIAEHKGTLSASKLGGCLRREKLRLMGVEETKETSPQMLRRMRWGVIYEAEVKQRSVAQGRRPRSQLVELEVDGVLIRGKADLVFTERVVEVKTTSAWEMDAAHLPFPHLIQLGTYMSALDRPGQFLYGSFWNEWSFDHPSLPDMWEPWVRAVAQLFNEYPKDDPRPFPAERLYCDECPYEDACPKEEVEPTDAPLSALEEQIVTRYLEVHRTAKASKKREEEAKAALLGVRDARGKNDKGITLLRLPTSTLQITESSYEKVDYTALDPKIKDALPRKPIIKNTIKLKGESGE